MVAKEYIEDVQVIRAVVQHPYLYRYICLNLILFR